jgi:nucleotide-binding universal stress UspA family protein
MDTYDVVLGVDSSEPRARAQAEAVADLPAASERVHATLLYVFAEPHDMDARQIGGIRLAADVLDDAGVETTLATRVGDPADQIVSLAFDVDADAICLGEWDRSRLEAALHGSVTRTVVRRAERPVVLCHASSP